MSTPQVVTVNGTPRPITQQETLDALITRLLGPVRAGIAVAVNGTVLPVDTWSGQVLAAGDEVEILTAVQGG